MKKILITIGVLMTMSFNTPENKTNWELYQAITDVEDYIEWLNEDLYQGKITQEYYNNKMVVFEFLLSRTLIIEKEIK